MKLADDLWLRSQAAQTSIINLIAYNTAFAGNAGIQAWKMGLAAPTGFWAALGRAGAAAIGEGPGNDVAPPAPSAEGTGSRSGGADDSAVPRSLDAPRAGRGDDLTSLTGIGPKLAAALNDCGIYHFDQLASLDAAGLEWLNRKQPGFAMICARHNVVDQAKARSVSP